MFMHLTTEIVKAKIDRIERGNKKIINKNRCMKYCPGWTSWLVIKQVCISF